MLNLFTNILNMTITASYVIIIVVILRLLFKRLPKIFSYILWVPVFFRLSVPFSFESIFSVFFFSKKSLGPFEGNPPNIIGAFEGQGQGQAINIADIAGQALNQGTSIGPIVSGSQDSWLPLIIGIWLLGILSLIIYSLVSSLKLRGHLKDSIKVIDNIYESSNIKTAFVFGLFMPKIFLPKGLNDSEKEYIIGHEKIHIKRKDHLLKILAFAILAVHWFNPLVWLAYYLMNEDMELSCDESVIRTMGPSIKKDYSASLLSLSTGRKILGQYPLAFGESNTKSRIKNILNYKKAKFWVVLLSIILVAGLIIGLSTNPPGNNLSKEEYAQEYIHLMLNNYNYAGTGKTEDIEYEILTFEKMDRFEDILNVPVEIWHLEYRWNPGDIDPNSLGNVHYEDGWIYEDDSMGFKALVFSGKGDSPDNYLGNLYSIDGLNGNGETVSGRETLLRSFLEALGLLEPENYPGDHGLAKFKLSTGESSQLLLSQPVTKGEGGIWCVERWMDGNGNVYYNIPETEGRIIDYYKELQAEYDQGMNTYLADPFLVAYEFINGKDNLGQIVPKEDIEISFPATYRDFLQTPESHYIGYITMFNMENPERPYLHFDTIEWLTIFDVDRLAQLNIDPDSLDNGYYIHNPASYPMYFQANQDTKYNIFDWEKGTEHKSVSAKEFSLLVRDMAQGPPFRMVTKDGYILSITEQYIP